MRPGYSVARVPNCSATTSGAWLGSITPPEPTRMRLRAAGDVAHQHRGGRTGHAVHVVVLGDPVAAVAPGFGVAGEVEAVAQGRGGVAAFDDGGEVEDGKRCHGPHHAASPSSPAPRGLSTPAAMAGRAASRSRAAPANRSTASPGGGIGARISTSSAACRGHQRPGRQQFAVAADDHRQHRHAGTRRRHEGAEVERQQARAGDEGALGKDRQRAAPAHDVGHALGVGHAAPDIEALDELGAQPPQVDAGHELRLQFTFGDEDEGSRQRCDEQHAVQVTAVVGNQHARAGGQVLQPAHAQRHAQQAQQRVRGGAAQRPGSVDATRRRRQQPGGGGHRQEDRQRPRSVHRAAGGGQRPAQAQRQRAAGEPQPLAARIGRGGADVTGLVERAAGRSPHLAAGGLQHRVRRCQHDLVGRLADGRDHRPRHRFAQRDARRRRQRPRLGQHHQALGAGGGVGAAEDRDAALAHAVHRTDRLLDFLRIEVAPGADDDVLDAAGDEEVVADPVGAVAAVQPAAVEQRGGLPRVAEIALRGRRAAEPQPALDALGDVAAVVVDQAHLVPGQRRAAGDEAQRRGVAGVRRHGAAFAREGLAPDGVDRRHAPQWREQQPDRALGQAVDRRHRLRRQSAGGEALAEAAHGVGTHRLGAVEGQSPRAQVEAGEVGVGDALEAQLVGEIRPRRQRAAPAVQRLHPAQRPRQEQQRRHHHERETDVHRRQPGADQPHVVVQRQPAHEDVARRGLDRARHGADVGQQVGVCQRHALGVAGAARGVLDEGDVVAAHRHRRAPLRPAAPAVPA